MAWFLAYLVTLAVEAPIVLWLMRAAGWVPRTVDGGLGWPAAVAVAWGLNLTHPVLWWVGPQVLGAVLAAEVIVVAVEGVALGLIAGRATRDPLGVAVLMGLLIAFAANFASFAVGAGLYGVGWLPA